MYQINTVNAHAQYFNKLYCNHPLVVLNTLFLESGNEKVETACLGGGCALLYSGVVATENCLTTSFRHLSEIGTFVINGALSFLNCLKNSSL